MHCPSILRRVAPPLSSVFLIAAFAAAADANPVCVDAAIAPARDTLARSADAVVCEINRLRAARGLPHLDSDSRLATAAGRHARHMVRRRYFSHVSPRGRTMTDRLRSAGYVADGMPWAVGETLAWGTFRLAAPGSIVAAWMRSRVHRRVLLTSQYRDVGVGVAVGTPLARARGPGATYAAELGRVGP